MKKKEEVKKNIIYIFKILILFALFVVLGYIHELLGMLMFGIMFLYILIGNNAYEVEDKGYVETSYFKQEQLNCDKTLGEESDNEKPKMKKYHLIIITFLFVLMYFSSYIRMEVGMLLFGFIIFYVFFVSE